MVCGVECALSASRPHRFLSGGKRRGVDVSDRKLERASRRLSVAIFIPTLNEISGMREILPRLSPDCYDELIVIDGGSTDGTVEYLEAQGVDVRREEKPGVVNAYNQAFRATNSEIFVTIQGDGNCLVELIPRLIEDMEKGYDIVFASRYLPPAKSHDDSRLTAIGNHMFTRLINVLFGARYTDVLGGFRAYRRSAVLRMQLDRQPDANWLTRRYTLLNTWEIGGCVRAAKLGLSVHEIPGDEPKRTGGKSKVSVIWNGMMVVGQILLELAIGRRFLQSAPPVVVDEPNVVGAEPAAAADFGHSVK
jgi:glycosyltransferase involved in cell wall biosynthesis